MEWVKRPKTKLRLAITPDGHFCSVRGFASNYNFSDKRLKKDIVEIDSNDALNKVKKLQV